jgi:phospholipid/cholesterol/gamma-HCH transport system substrate-binding protein
VNKRAPSVAQIMVMVVFALSCFGLLTYIWKSFGGPSPLAPKGYQVQADFQEATQLADTAEVRISGVPVGRVVKTDVSGERTRVMFQIEERYAPIPRDTRAILRQKTLLGETYIELSPGDRRSGELFDGGRLPNTQIESTVELDEVTRGLDARTRHDLQRFVAALGALEDDGEELNDALGQFPRFSRGALKVLRVLDTQDDAVRKLVRDSGVVFDALGRRQGELSGLVRAADAVLATTARRDAELAETVRILPTTLAELRPTLELVRDISREARPLVRDLRPGARALGPALVDANVLAPQARALFGDIDRLIDVAKAGVPATTEVVNAARPLFQRLDPTLAEAAPVVDYLGLYRHDMVAQLAGFGSSLQASTPAVAGGPPIHYLRALVPFTAEGLDVFAERLGNNRPNPYFAPRALDKLKQGLETFSCEHENNDSTPEPAPRCRMQTQVEFQGRRTAYTQIRRAR